MLLNIRNPWVWLSRLRYRKGYGVHSPFAFQFITQVLYTPGRYYADEWLELQFSRWERLAHVRQLAICRLLFRLANHWQPKFIGAWGAGARELSYLHQGCRQAELLTESDGRELPFLYVNILSDDAIVRVGDRGLLVVDKLRENLVKWEALKQDARVNVTFDLYDVGIAVFDSRLQRQDYMINW